MVGNVYFSCCQPLEKLSWKISAGFRAEGRNWDAELPSFLPLHKKKHALRCPHHHRRSPDLINRDVFMQQAHHSWASATRRCGICHPLTNNSISETITSFRSLKDFSLWMAGNYKIRESFPAVSVVKDFIHSEKLQSYLVLGCFFAIDRLGWPYFDFDGDTRWDNKWYSNVYSKMPSNF